MTVKVVALELTEPFPSFQDLDLTHYTHLQLLVRYHQQPLGYVWLFPRHRRFLAEPFIRHEIERQLYDRLNQAEFERLLAGDSTGQTANQVECPSMTVAVCTRGRPQSLRRTLASLLLLDYPVEKWELLVVDNAPDDNTTARVVADFPRCKYVVESRPGLNWARNCAVLEASGEIIAYTDDDVEVDSQWLRSLAHHFVNPAVMCVTGLVVPAQRETPAQNLFEEYGGFGRGFETRYFTMGVRKYWRYWPLGAGIFGTGCNMAFRRSLFDRIGLFDVALDVGTPSQGAGDHDLFYRTIRANYILVYEPRAIIWHYHRSDMTALQRQLRDFGRGVYAFWTKTFLTDSQMRWRTLTFAMSWYLQWFGGRLLHGHPGGRFPRGLVLIEAIGALQGPWAYILAHYQGRHMAHKRHSLRTTVPDTDREMRPSSFEALDVKRDI